MYPSNGYYPLLCLRQQQNRINFFVQMKTISCMKSYSCVQHIFCILVQLLFLVNLHLKCQLTSSLYIDWLNSIRSKIMFELGHNKMKKKLILRKKRFRDQTTAFIYFSKCWKKFTQHFTWGFFLCLEISSPLFIRIEKRLHYFLLGKNLLTHNRVCFSVDINKKKINTKLNK